MTITSEPVYRSRASSLALRYALRELRSGLRGFYVFIACIALGVMAIAGVGSVAASLSEGLTREGRTLLGGDVAFSLIQRQAKPEEIAFLRARGQVSVAAALRVMARSSDGKLALVELKAVDGNYPMLGEVTLDPGQGQRLSRIALDDAFRGQKSKKNLQSNDNQFDRRSGKPGAFAVGEVFADERKGDGARIVDFFLCDAPLREFVQRSLGGELIIFRQTALDRQEADKRVDRLFHCVKDSAKGQVLAIARLTMV